jgi:hypothetical protein
MKKTALILFVVASLLAGPISAAGLAAPWSGVDESVIEKFAEQAGRPAWEPFLNTDQGDLLLFVFLLAGTIGGFAAGYWFRTLFPPRRKTAVGSGFADPGNRDGLRDVSSQRVLRHDV